MKNSIIVFASFIIITFAVHSQTAVVNTQNSSMLPLPQELQIGYHNSSLDESRYDKSFIPEDKLTYEALYGNDDIAIKATLQNYIDGSTGGQPNLLKEVFHPDLKLYYIKNNKVSTWDGTAYIEDTKQGQPTGEIGKILSIDYTNDAAVAKVEIAHPESNSIYIDYFMLLKSNGTWTIIHKMFTKKNNS